MHCVQSTLPFHIRRPLPFDRRHALPPRMPAAVGRPAEGLVIRTAATDEEAERARAKRARAGADGPFRVVRTREQAAEKLAIFDAGLDDRVVEIYKVLLLAQLRDERPGLGGVELTLFAGGDGRPRLRLTNGARALGEARLDPSAYRLIEESYRAELSPAGPCDPVVNRDWALDFLRRAARAENA